MQHNFIEIKNVFDPPGEKSLAFYMITVEPHEKNLILHVNEPRIDMVVARKFREELKQSIQEKPPRIILNLKETEYFDSSALGALVAFMKDIKSYGGQLVLCNLSRSLHTLLKLSKLDILFEIADDLEKAKAPR